MNKIKYFVFSDVHGEYNALRESLQEAGYDSSNPNHKLISIGDAFDRGQHSAIVCDFLMSEKAIAIKGNHDVMLEEYLDKGMNGEFVLFNILHNGLGATISSFTGLQDKEFNYKIVDEARKNINPRVIKWIHDMPLYYETQNFIFVHAGLNPDLLEWKNTDEDFMLWDIECSHLPCPFTSKCVVIGHHHASRVRQNGMDSGFAIQDIDGMSIRLKDENGHTSQGILRSYGNTDENRPYCYCNKIAIDGCTNLTKKVNVLVIEDYPLPEKKEETQSELEGEVSSPEFRVKSEDGTVYCTYANNPFRNIGMNVQDFAGAVYTTATIR